ncbi:MAG: Peroxiredoxin [Phycisphaerales bacterium]|nr:Peroxiredoxin [Phycisphaerales bacterium]
MSVATPPASWACVPTIGSAAPDFLLPRHDGGTLRLHDCLSPSGVVLVFFRGHWCPYCRRYLGKLRDHAGRIRAGGTQLVAVSPEPPTTAAALVADLELGFPVLSDAGAVVIDRYGTRNGFAGAPAMLPHPSVFVIDRDGVVRFRSVDRNYKKRTTVRTILAEVAEMTGQVLPTP